MARFYDRLRRDNAAIDPELNEKLGGATIIDGTNLSDYLYANEAKGEWDLVKDFFNIAPPFEKFFVECRAPRQLLTKQGMVSWPSHLPGEWGVLFLATDMSTMGTNQKVAFLGMGLPDNVKWVIQAILFTETPQLPNIRNGGKMKEQFTWWFPVLADGSQPVGEPRDRSIKIEYVIDKNIQPLEPKFHPSAPGSDSGTMEMTPEMFELVNVRNVDSICRFWYPDNKSIPLNQGMSQEEWDKVVSTPTNSYIKVLSLQEDILSMKPSWQFQYTVIEEQHWLPLLQPCLMSVCFLHVKNVTMERVTPAPPVQKKAKKRYGEPLCTYHVLQVQPFKQVLEKEGNVSQTGIRKAMHLCRGSFHHYGDEFGKGKLFGKISGSFWVPAHIRGAIEQGMVDKSYKMAAGAK